MAARGIDKTRSVSPSGYMAIIGAAVIAYLLACASVAGPPDWTEQRAILQGTGDERFFYGVGFVANIGDPHRAAELAQERARTNLYQLLRSYSHELVLEYQREQDGRGSPVAQKHAEQLVRLIERVGMQHAALSERWPPGLTEPAWALVRLRLRDLMGPILWDKSLAQELRDFFSEYAAVVHQRMTLELDPNTWAQQ